jgi:DNA end-binding protein Ku
MASTVWKGYISFGLISIPVRLFVAARKKRVSFHQIHKVCNTRIRQQLYCPTCEQTVDRADIIKGYEYEKETYVLVEGDDLRKIAPPSSDVMEILEFVRLNEIDPMYFDVSYFIVPEEAGRKAYQLLRKTMDNTGYAAVARLAMHQREYTVTIRSREHGLALHTMYYPNEVREVPEYANQPDIEVKEKEIHLAEQLVNSLATHFNPGKYSDRYQERVFALIEAKSEGRKGVAATPHRRVAPVINLMEALEKSLAGKKKQPKRAEPSAARRKRAS